MSSDIPVSSANKICSLLQKARSLESITASLRVLLADLYDITSWGLFFAQHHRPNEYNIQYLVDNMKVLRTHHNSSVVIDIHHRWLAMAMPKFFFERTDPQTGEKIAILINNKQWLTGGVCVVPLQISSDMDVTNTYDGSDASHYIGVLIINNWKVKKDGVAHYLELLTPLSMVLSQAIFACNTIRKLQRDVLTDYLTGLFNRRFFVSVADRQVAEANRYKRPLSFFVIDIDGFKQINDTHGHLVGDKVLINLAEVLQKSVRKVDYVIRFAGDEFVILMPNTTKHQMEEILKRLKNTHSKFGHVGTIEYTASVGKFSGIPRSLNEMFSVADNDMYKQKASNAKSRKQMPHSREADLDMDDAVVNTDAIIAPSQIIAK